MSKPEDNDLFAISVDADNYADAAAADNPAAPSRTHQSEADFQKIKASYTAKIDNGNTYQDLITAVPVLVRSVETTGTESVGVETGNSKVKLGKKGVQLLGYAVAELYYDRDYAGVIDLCGRVRGRCEIDRKTAENMEKWVARCGARLDGPAGG